MKKFITLLLTTFLTFTLFAATCSEYRVKLTDKIEVGTSEAFECVATIAHLAGFPEYCLSSVDYSSTDEYFQKYLSKQEVKDAIKYFQLQNSIGFQGDAVAIMATYITPDCQNLRTDVHTVKQYIDVRCSNPEKMLKHISAFYKATKFDKFYKSQIPLYKEYVEKYLQNKDQLITIIDHLEKYYHESVPSVFVSLSNNSNGNYGVSYEDGETFSFEPKFQAGNFNEMLIVHELSHPFSNPFADKLYEKASIKPYVDNGSLIEDKNLLLSQGYNSPYNYLIELINRANTMAILQEFMDKDYVTLCILDEKISGFTQIQELTDILSIYKEENYNSIMDFADVFEQKFSEVIKERKNKTVKTKFSPEATKTFKLFDKEYNATYCGSNTIPYWGEDVTAKFWIIENAYEDIKNIAKYTTGNFFPNNLFPGDLQENQVFRMEVEYKSQILIYYYCNTKTIFRNNENSNIIWME